jgi:hypothetical protein
MCKNSGSRSGINNPDHISESSETIFFKLKYLNSLMRIRDGKNKIRIRDKHPGSATLFPTSVPDPDPFVRGMDPDPDRSIIVLSSSKNSKKNIDSYCSFYFFLYLKNDDVVPSKSNKAKNFF